MSIAENIKRLREEKGLSQFEFAKIVGVSQPMIAQIERGTKNPSFQIGVEIAKRFGISMEELANGTDNKT